VTTGGQGRGQETRSGASEQRGTVPAIALPKGGGALQSIGETFRVNPATGTGSLTIPIAVSPGRSGVGPALALAYDSGAGNGPYGLGWGLGLPSIDRKTEKGLPRYDDDRESDTFILSGAEDLVPALVQREDGSWTREVVDDAAYSTSRGEGYEVHRYRPRIEGLFARVERWVRRSDGDTHWRAITGDNRTSVYGETDAARVVDPSDRRRVFQWLIERTYDDKGNVVVFRYVREDDRNIDLRAPEERNRLRTGGAFSQRYLKRVLYGNSRPYRPHAGATRFDEAEWQANNRWHFQLVLDYGDHDDDAPSPDAVRPWPVRPDRFSTYRAGFEIRTYRLCRRLLMFHHFDELGPEPYLVRATELAHSENPVATQLRSVTHVSYESGRQPARLPPVRLAYSQAEVDETVHAITPEEAYELPDGRSRRWYDLQGEGLSGILSQHPNAWYYRRNLGDERFGERERTATLPSVAAPGDPGQQLTDLDGDGRTDLVSMSPSLPGYYELSGSDEWEPFTAFRQIPNLAWDDPSLRLIDLTGDGHPDLLVTEDRCLRWYPADGGAGYAPAQTVPKPLDEEIGPAIVFAETTQSIFLADMCGDGLTDIIRIRNGEVCYWPNTGYGTFGAKVTMHAPPLFDHHGQFDARRLRLGDIDGSGTADVLYVGARSLRFWHNHAGNGWSEGHEMSPGPPADALATVELLDLLGRGTACVVWSRAAPADRWARLQYLPMMSAGKPYLLTEIDNGMGALTRLQHAPSTTFYLRDRDAGRPWITRLPFPVHVVERTETHDRIRGTRFVSLSAYHHGHYDGEEREFRGFGMVEQWDTERYAQFGEPGLFSVGSNHLDEASHVPPVCTKTWFHTGFFEDRDHISRLYADEHYQGDEAAWLLPDTALPPDLTAEEQREACRALKGRMLRQEVYAHDGTVREDAPYSVVEKKLHIRREQPREQQRHAVFYVCDCETLTYNYEREPGDPRIAHAHTLEIDRYGNVVKAAAIAYSRRGGGLPEQARALVTYTEAEFIHVDGTASSYRIGLPFEQRSFEVTGLPARDRWRKEDLLEVLASAPEVPHTTAPGASAAKRLLSQARTSYYADTLDGVLPWEQAGSLGIRCEELRLAFTQEMLDQPELGGRIRPDLLAEGGYRNNVDGDPTHWWIPSGREVYDPARSADMFYLPTGVEDPFGAVTSIGYDEPYYLFAVRVTDPLHNVSRADYDYRVLAPFRLADPNGNRSQVIFDTRGMVIATAVMGKADAGVAEGDAVDGHDRIAIPIHADGIPADVGPAIMADPRGFLQDATTVFHYDPFAWLRDGGPSVALKLAREAHASDGATAVQMTLEYSDGAGRTLQAKLQAEDGLAPVYDEDGQLLLDDHGAPRLAWSTDRWVGSGAAVLNNKGLPVKQYEPFFDSRPDFADDDILVKVGVSPTLHYDPLGRTVRTDLPDGSFSRVEFDAWQQTTYDPNDTVRDSDWYAAASDAAATEAQRAAAAQAAAHHDTPTRAYLDVLGRAFVTVAESSGDEFVPTRTELDVEGRPLAICDGRRCEGLTLDEAVRHRGNTVIAFVYAPGWQPLHQRSMDAGERWTLSNVAGNPLHGWDERGHHLHTRYDELQRPTHVQVEDGTERTILAERLIYGDTLDDPDSPDDEAARLNLRGRLHLHLDGAGLVRHDRFDFTGNLVESSRRLAREYRYTPDWSALAALTPEAIDASSLLEDETFTTRTRHDALGRVIQNVTAHSDRVPPNVIQPTYNKANLLERVDLWLQRPSPVAALIDSEAEPPDRTPIIGVDYNARGQRVAIEYDNGAHCTYDYNEFTFRLERLRTQRDSGTNGLQDLHFTYDPIGNITEIRDDAIQPVFFRNEVVEARSRYRYDALYRLTEATGRESAATTAMATHDDIPAVERIPADDLALRNYTERYRYDPAGNMLELRHSDTWTRTYEYERASNRLRSHNLPASAVANYSYDAHGNMLSMPHLRGMEWDHRDQLRHVEVATDQEAFFTYASDRQRVRKVWLHGGFRDERIYLGDVEVFRRYPSSGTAAREELHTLHVSDFEGRVCLVEMPIDDGADRSRRFRYQVSSHLGSVTVELDEHARVLTYEEYHPYGTTAYRARNGTVEVSAKRYRYTGMEHDDETGLNYHTARYYVPWLARWCNPDPKDLAEGTNDWVYARANPVSRVDPGGSQSHPLDRLTPSEAWQLSIDNPALYEMWAGAGLGGEEVTTVDFEDDHLLTAEPDPCRRGSGTMCDPTVIERAEEDAALGRGAAKTAAEVVTFGLGHTLERIGRGDVSGAVEEAGRFVYGLTLPGQVEGAVSVGATVATALGPAPTHDERVARNEARGGLGVMGISALAGTVGGGLGHRPGRGPLTRRPLDAGRRTGLAASGEASGWAHVPGQTTRAVESAEWEQLMRGTLHGGNEISESIVGGTLFQIPGGRNKVGVMLGPDVTQTVHTHPSGVALFSAGDVHTYQAGGYGPSTRHVVLGIRWPETAQVLRELGSEPLPLRVVQTEMTQGMVGRWYPRPGPY
jgi:RHS repeat-associated protein